MACRWLLINLPNCCCLNVLMMCRISHSNKLSKSPSVAETIRSPCLSSNSYFCAHDGLSWHIQLFWMRFITFVSAFDWLCLPRLRNISMSVFVGRIDSWYGVLKECYCSLDFNSIWGSPSLLNRTMRKPESPMFDTLSILSLSTPIIAVAEPIVPILLYAFCKIICGSKRRVCCRLMIYYNSFLIVRWSLWFKSFYSERYLSKISTLFMSSCVIFFEFSFCYIKSSDNFR